MPAGMSLIKVFMLAMFLSGLAVFAQLDVRFVDVTAEAGIDFVHGYDAGNRINEVKMMATGAAVGDFDKDGHLDLFFVTGDIGDHLLFRNLGNGAFEEVAEQAGVAHNNGIGSGPAFIDFDGDTYLDLWVPGVEGTPPMLYKNRGDGTFFDATAESGLVIGGNTFSTAYGDFDRDGDLDLFMGHWIGYPDANGGHLWRNNGDGSFTDADAEAGILAYQELDFSFTPNFSDVNGDNWPDLLVAGDFGTSQVFINNGDGTFLNTTDSEVITDENGMGSAIGDYDNDGDLDWFVSSVFNPSGEPSGPGGMTGYTGNRMYRNMGDGTFEDATDEAGVRIGYWGWGSNFVDFDNDGNQDLVHVNGFPMGTFFEDPTRLFRNNGDGTFTETSNSLGITDKSQGRGVICFDYDRDGDQDILVVTNSQSPILYRNDGGNNLSWLNISLAGKAPNPQGLGAKIYVTSHGVTQMREVRCSNNFLSHQPAEVHVGLGSATRADQIRVIWPDGSETVMNNVGANQFLTIPYGFVENRPERPDRPDRPDM